MAGAAAARRPHAPLPRSGAGRVGFLHDPFDGPLAGGDQLPGRARGARQLWPRGTGGDEPRA
ncbi:MAG: hypothetical protein ACK56I_04430, partial [bacterium]